MKSYISISLLTLALLTSCSQPPAAVVNKGDLYFGRYETFKGKEEVATYSSDRQATQPPTIAAKYKKQEYGISSPVPEVEVSDIGAAKKPKPPEPVELSEVAVIAQAESPLDKKVEAAKMAETVPEVKAEQLPQVSKEPVKLASTVDAKQPELLQADLQSQHFVWPVQGKVISKFGPKMNGLVNDGVNISAKEGTPIGAAADGEVVYVGNALTGYGNMAIVRHADGWMTAYAHASRIAVKKGDKVKRGAVIGYVGKSGDVSSPQLHFGVREGKKPVNPEAVLPKTLTISG